MAYEIRLQSFALALGVDGLHLIERGILVRKIWQNNPDLPLVPTRWRDFVAAPLRHGDR